MAALDLRENPMSTKPITHNGDLANLPPALQPLTRQDRWVVWPWEQRTKKSGEIEWTKPPRQVRNPNHNAKSNDPTTWGHLSAAVQRVADGEADGIGFMLLNSDIGAGDLDHVAQCSKPASSTPGPRTFRPKPRAPIARSQSQAPGCG